MRGAKMLPVTPIPYSPAWLNKTQEIRHGSHKKCDEPPKTRFLLALWTTYLRVVGPPAGGSACFIIQRWETHSVFQLRPAYAC